MKFFCFNRIGTNQNGVVLCYTEVESLTAQCPCCGEESNIDGFTREGIDARIKAQGVGPLLRF